MHWQRKRLPTLHELVAFESVARNQSMTKAGEELALTQGAISRQIASLEMRLGSPLFDRVRRSVRLTDVGRIYLGDVERVLAQLSEATDSLARFGTANVLNLAVLPTFATRWLMPRLPRFLATAGDVSFNCTVKLEPFDFEREPYDAAIHFGRDDWPGAKAHFLCREETIAVASPELLVRTGINTPSDLMHVALLHQTTRPNAWADWFAAQGVSEGHRARGPHLDQFGMIVEAAIAGIGVALVPRFVVRAELANGLLQEIGGNPVVTDKAYWIVVPTRAKRNTQVDAFVKWLQRETQGGPEASTKRG